MPFHYLQPPMRQAKKIDSKQNSTIWKLQPNTIMPSPKNQTKQIKNLKTPN